MAGQDFKASIEANRVSEWIVALLPIPVFWLLAYLLVGLVRWIRAGFKPST
jgi:hypothetical protein